MELWKNPGWLKEDQREKMFDHYVDQAGKAWFGLKEFRTEEKRRAVLDHFNKVAPKYDFLNTVLSFGIHYAWKREAIRMMALSPGDRVIDVCGGTGDLAVLSARKVGPKGWVCVYDINRAMMHAGETRPENRKFEDRISYVEGDAENITFPENHFDAATVGFGIRNLTHLQKGFSEMFRVLKPGGTFMCLEFSKPVNPVFRTLYDFYSFTIMPFVGGILTGSSRSYACLSETIRMFALPDELKEMLETIGFRNVHYKRLMNGIAAVHVATK